MVHLFKHDQKEIWSHIGLCMQRKTILNNTLVMHHFNAIFLSDVVLLIGPHILDIDTIQISCCVSKYAPDGQQVVH